MGLRSRAILVQHSLHEKVSADKRVARHSFAKFAEGIRDANHFFNHGHVAILAALLFFKIACEPLLIRHLFGKFADLRPPGPRAVVISVWQVAHNSDCRTLSPSVGR